MSCPHNVPYRTSCVSCNRADGRLTREELRTAPPPPTLSEACEVIRGLLDEPEDCACRDDHGGRPDPGDPCLFHAPAYDFLKRMEGK